MEGEPPNFDTKKNIIFPIQIAKGIFRHPKSYLQLHAQFTSIYQFQTKSVSVYLGFVDCLGDLELQVTNMEFQRHGSNMIGRQSQTWLSLLACKNGGHTS
jgi:hypothetical protein